MREPRPYLNGSELPTEPGLPLGLVPNLVYAETSLTVDHTGQLTFVSDGVLEAVDGSGQLFGYDRAGQVSTRSGSDIAQTAIEFARGAP